MGKSVLLLIIMSIMGCVHKLENVSDLKINTTYQMVGGDHTISKCTIKAQNIATVIPSQQDKIASIPMINAIGTPAMVCGKVDCSKNIPGDGAEYDCVPLQILQKN